MLNKNAWREKNEKVKIQTVELTNGFYKNILQEEILQNWP